MTITATMLDAALEWAKIGKVFPVKPDKKPYTEHGLKDAAQVSLIIREYWQKWPNANIGLVCDGLLVIDFDEKPAKDGKPAACGLTIGKPALIAKYGPLPRTRVHRTGSGGEHWLYSVPTDLNIRPGAGKYGYPGMDIRANDSYILVPPSRNESGPYTVIDDSPIVSPPEWLIELAKNPQGKTATSKATITPLKDGQRHSDLIAFIGKWRARGFSEAEIETQALALNRDCPEPLSEPEVLKMVQQYAHQQRGGNDYNLTDAGNGEAIADTWRHKVRYVFEWKSWLIYDGARWVKDTKFEIKKNAIRTMRDLCAAAVNIEDKDKRKKTTEWYFSSESDKRIQAALNMVMAQPGISIRAESLDANPWLLNVANGTIDLETMTFREHRAADLLTQKINITYNPEATAPEWESFLYTIFNQNIELIKYIQRAIGYTINGTQLERIMFFLYGLGKNGKSQLMAACRKVLGDYADEAKPELFMEKRFANSGPDEGQAALRGIRLLTATETKRGQNLDTGLIKRMTGGEPIWCERKFQSGYSVMPTHTLWLSGNYEPLVKDSTDSIWDRINKIPFECRITADKEIKGYGDLLATKYPEAILAWMIQGARDWKVQGLSAPDCVKLANQEYRESQDILHEFIVQCIEKQPGAKSTITETYEAYLQFPKDSDDNQLTKRQFNQAMREKGFKDRRGSHNNPEWQNLALKSYLVTKVTKNTESFPDTPAREETFPQNGNLSNISNPSNQNQLQNEEIRELPA